MDGTLSPMIATAEKPVAAISSVDNYEMWSPVGAPIDAEMYKTFAKFGSLPRLAGAAPGPPGHRPDEQVREELSGVGAIESPVAYPETNSPTSSPGSPTTSTANCRCRW